ncbi:putative DNA-binding transcriptional regulator [Yokenella regensburgei]|uniref:YfeC-like transcriptional regulator n=1 Tax=Yokenella regensburgei TaxID=158877 RepID=UPI003F16BE2D
MKLPDKMTTEELAEFLGVAKQTVNRWIRQHKWSTERLPGIKGGRARLIHLNKDVRLFIMKTPGMRHRISPAVATEPLPYYASETLTPALLRILNVLKNLTPYEQEALSVLLAREGIHGLLDRLQITQPEER